MKPQCREAWRDYGAALLAKRELMPSNKEFGAWVKATGLDADPASSAVDRSNAIWLAQNWSVLERSKIENHHPTGIRQECRDMNYAWAFDQREPKAKGKS